MKQPMSTMNMAIATATMLAVILSSARAADDALVATTCKAARASDMRVNLQLCESRLSNNTASNVWGLAKVASDACISGTIMYHADLVALTVEMDAGNKEFDPIVEALVQCNQDSSYARDFFEAAKKEINQRVYAAAMKQLDEGMSRTQNCTAGITAVKGAKMPEPLGHHVDENIQLAIIAKAITSLIK